MKCINRAGLCMLVLAGGLAAVVSGCDTSLASTPQVPLTITNVYALDVAVPQGSTTALAFTATGGNFALANPIAAAPTQLPDVMLFSNTQADRTSPFPPVYGGLRIEFSQTLDPTAVATQATLSGATFCLPVGGLAAPTPALKLIDATNNAELQSSICYNPASNLGEHPSLSLTIGGGQASAAATSTPSSPFTCTAFTPEDLTGNPAATSGDVDPIVLLPNHQYKLMVNTAAVKTVSGGTFNTPSQAAQVGGGQWSADGTTFTFKTSDFDLMAVGYQDPNTGFFSWLDKPYKGFEKDLDADPHWSDCVPTPNKAAPCMPTDDTPLMLVFSRAVAQDASGVPQPPGSVTSMRAAGSPFGSDYKAFIFSDLATVNINGDPRIIFVEPGNAVQFGSPAGRWEPDQTYTLTVNSGLEACDDLSTTTVVCNPGSTPSTLGTTKNYTFKAQSGSVAVVNTTPTAGALAQSLNPTFVIQFAEPVDPTTVSASTITLTGPNAPALTSIATDAASNNDVVTAKVASRLTPATQYTLSINGVKAADAATPGTGTPFPAKSVPFTTATFRISSLTRTCIEFPNNTECSNLGAAATPPGGARSSIDRGANQPLSLLDNKDLILGFTNPYDISTLTTTGSNPTLTLSEHVTTGTGTPIPMTLTAASATGLTVNIDRSAASTYAIKCNQQYDFTLTTGAKDTFGNTASAEGGGKDVHFFRTAPFAPQPFSSSASRVINRKTSGSAPGLTTCSSLSPCFVVTFNAPLDVASTNALLARCGGTDPKKCPMQVFTTPSGGQPTFAAMSCPAISTGAKEIACQPSAPLTSATRYTASFVILSTPTTEKLQAASPAPVLGPPDYATQVGSQTMPLDAGPTGTCTFSGNSSVTFTTSGTTC